MTDEKALDDACGKLGELLKPAYISTLSPEYEPCASCNGSGLALNGAGEPDECRECSGNTVVPASPDVSGLVERLRKVSSTLKEYGWGDVMVDPPKEAADALASLSLQLAAVEGERDQLRTGIKRLSDEEELCAETTGDDPFSLVYLAAKLADAERAIDIAQSSLNAAIADYNDAQEENERLRTIISNSAEALENGAFIAPTCSIDFMSGLPNEIRLHVATLSTPSKEDKTDG